MDNVSDQLVKNSLIKLRLASKPTLECERFVCRFYSFSGCLLCSQIFPLRLRTSFTLYPTAPVHQRSVIRCPLMFSLKHCHRNKSEAIAATKPFLLFKMHSEQGAVSRLPTDGAYGEDEGAINRDGTSKFGTRPRFG